MIIKTREKINALPYSVDNNLKQLLLDMTGTNDRGKYSGGDNLHGWTYRLG